MSDRRLNISAFLRRFLPATGRDDRIIDADGIRRLKEIALAQPEPQATGAKCEDCARPYGDQHGFPDLVVPHSVWEKLMPGRDGAGLLCPSCMCKRGHDLGIKSGAVFTSGPFVASDAQQAVVMSPKIEKLMPDFTDAPVPVQSEFPPPPASGVKYWRGRVENLEREIQHVEKTMLKLSDALAAEKKRSRLANARADKEAKDAARFSLWLKPFWVFAEKNGCPPGVKQTDFVLAMAAHGLAMNGGCTAKEARELRTKLDEALSSVDVLAKELNAAMADAANSPKPVVDTLERRVRRLEVWAWDFENHKYHSEKAERRLREHEAKQNGSA